MRLLLGFILLTLCCHAGCALCPPGYLNDYATVGGKWQRSNPTTGRVGSILSDPGSTTHAEAGAIYSPYHGDAPVVYPEDVQGGQYYDSEINGQMEYSIPGVGESVPAPVPDPMSNLEDF